ncbi:MAG: multiubiquitin domain-containing protein [Nitrospira sp.]|nr:multiubiquitin domain-containing protein [Nitrospira sp.]
MSKQNPDGSFELEVNGTVVTFKDPVPTASQILREGGFTPTDEHILIRLQKGSSNALGLNEPIDLRNGESAKFRAFRSDRVFRLTLDGGGFEWGEGTISESELRKLAAVGDDKVLVLERRDEPDRELNYNDQVALMDAGTEHIRTIKKLIVVVIDGVEKQIDRGTYKTEQLLAILGVETGYLLNVLSDDGQLKTLNSGDHVSVREGMKFFSQVPCGGSA